MRKGFSLILTMVLLVAAAACTAEAPASILETMAGLEWTFTSGAGAWSTDLQFQPDGSFTGMFHDSEMGECEEAYPDGTVYVCSFSGRMSYVEQVNGNTWKFRVDELKKEDEEEIIADGVRYVPAEPYGLSEGDTMLLYSPGTPVNFLSEEMQLWAHILDQETPPTELEDWFLSSEANDSGFVGMTPLYTANPWEDMTAEQLEAASGLRFTLPQDAENPAWRYMRSENLAEMWFTMNDGEYCARIQPMAPVEGEMTDISGMYYTWENEEKVRIGDCDGTIAQARDGDGWVERCLWYDAAKGLQYSLTVIAADVDGLDLTAVAEQICAP